MQTNRNPPRDAMTMSAINAVNRFPTNRLGDWRFGMNDECSGDSSSTPGYTRRPDQRDSCPGLVGGSTFVFQFDRHEFLENYLKAGEVGIVSGVCGDRFTVVRRVGVDRDEP